MAKQTTRILAVTGTKGKTTISRVLAFVLNNVLIEPVLAADNDRITLGGKIHATREDSLKNAGLLPTICPGRYLAAISNHKNPVAVFETSLGCGRGAGVGYRRHEIGMFTNVYDDHVGNRPDLQTREDIAKIKSFIFKRIGRSGYAIYNPDDPLVAKALEVIDPARSVKKVACGLGKKPQDADIFVTKIDGEIVIEDGANIQKILVSRLAWLLGGSHEPTLRNGLYIVAALYGFFIETPAKFAKALTWLEKYVPKVDGGRMVHTESYDGYKVILDFAHEAQSLAQLGKYAQSLKSKGGQVIGVVRLTDDRLDSYITEVTKTFAPTYDRLVIYDKIDGHWRQSTANVKNYRYQRHVGEVSSLMLKAAREVGVEAEQVIREDQAMVRAAELAKPGDIVVSIINKPERSYTMAHKAFKLKV